MRWQNPVFFATNENRVTSFTSASEQYIRWQNHHWHSVFLTDHDHVHLREMRKEFTEKRNLTRHMKTHQEKSRVAANTEVLPDDPEIHVLYLRHWDRGSDRQPCPWPVQLYPAWDDAVHYLEHNIYTSLDVHLGANMFVTAESPALHLDIRHYYWINDKRHPSMDNKVTGEE
jgi:hypothetical protein